MVPSEALAQEGWSPTGFELRMAGLFGLHARFSTRAFARRRLRLFFSGVRFLARDESGRNDDQQQENIIRHSDDRENHV